MNETLLIVDFLKGKLSKADFCAHFKGKMTDGFDPDIHLTKFGVVNQTTMLATETQEIADVLQKTMVEIYGSEDIRDHFADTRDTLCYATNDNQSATLELLNYEADLAVVVGGYNSSNTSHLVEMLEQKFETFFIKNADEIKSRSEIDAFNMHIQNVETRSAFLPEKEQLKIIITSGASCPDSAVDRVIQKILNELNIPFVHDVNA
jgi:4-hydroxy-3-methylbut-2-enyl diphosphate reductase